MFLVKYGSLLFLSGIRTHRCDGGFIQCGPLEYQTDTYDVPLFRGNLAFQSCSADVQKNNACRRKPAGAGRMVSPDSEKQLSVTEMQAA